MGPLRIGTTGVAGLLCLLAVIGWAVIEGALKLLSYIHITVG